MGGAGKIAACEASEICDLRSGLIYVRGAAPGCGVGGGRLSFGLLAIQDVFRLTGRQLVAPIPQGRSSGQMGDGTVAWGRPSTQGLGGLGSKVCAVCTLGDEKLLTCENVVSLSRNEDSSTCRRHIAIHDNQSEAPRRQSLERCRSVSPAAGECRIVRNPRPLLAHGDGERPDESSKG